MIFRSSGVVDMWKVLVLGVAVGAVVLVAVLSWSPDEKPAGTPTAASVDEAVVANDPSSRPGDPSVYARIETETDCVALQREFDVAMSNWERIQKTGGDSAVPESYAEAADNRLSEVGCYG